MLNAAVTTAQTTPLFWIICGSFAAFAWVAGLRRIRSVTRDGASEVTLKRMRWGLHTLLLFVVIAIVRLVAHAY